MVRVKSVTSCAVRTMEGCEAKWSPSLQSLSSGIIPSLAKCVNIEKHVILNHILGVVIFIDMVFDFAYIEFNGNR